MSPNDELMTMIFALKRYFHDYADEFLDESEALPVVKLIDQVAYHCHQLTNKPEYK